MSSLITRLRDVWKVYMQGGNVVPVLRGISFDVEEGEFLLIRGPSGSGKSTLLKLMGLLDVPSKGSVVIDGFETIRLTEDERAGLRNRKIGFVFQSFNLIPELTVLENVMLPAWIGGMTSPKLREEALDLLKTVGLEGKERSLAGQLSGGQMQRVAIARSLINRPSIVLADEPTGNLDSKNAAHVLELFKALNEENGQTVILISHDNRQEKYADRTLTIIDGQITNAAMDLPVLEVKTSARR